MFDLMNWSSANVNSLKYKHTHTHTHTHHVASTAVTVTSQVYSKFLPWAQQPAEQCYWQAVELCSAWTPPSQVHQVYLLDSRWQNATEHGCRFCHMPSQDTLDLKCSTQRGTVNKWLLRWSTVQWLKHHLFLYWNYFQVNNKILTVKTK